jgi:hypothetical protein
LADPDGLEIDLNGDGESDDSKDITENEDGSVDIDIDPADSAAEPGEYIQTKTHGDNLAELLPESVLTSIGQSLCAAIEEDIRSRREWESGLQMGLKYLGTQPAEMRTKPFKGASAAYDNMMLKALIRFQATAFKELQPAQGPVKTQIIGSSGVQNMQKATRKRTYLNWYLTLQAPEYRPEFKSMLWWVGLEGGAFKKIYYDEVERRPVSRMIRAIDIIVPYGSTDVFTAKRVTHRFTISAREIKQKQLAGDYRATDANGLALKLQEKDLTDKVNQTQVAEDMAIGMTPTKADIDKDYLFYETQAFIDIQQSPHMEPSTDADGNPLMDEDGNPSDPVATGLPLPYRVTMDSMSQTVVSIVRDWEESDNTFQRQTNLIYFPFVPGMGFYGLGFAHILGNPAMSATALRRQVTDAATLAMMPSGVRAKGARFADNNIQVQPLEFPEVDTGGQPISNFLMPFSFKGPDPTSLALLQETYKQGEDLSSTTEIAVGEGRQDAPVGTIMALLEAATRIETSVVAGLHDSLGIELRMLSHLFGQVIKPGEPYPFDFNGPNQHDMKGDFANNVDVVPVSDPNIASGTQRLVRAQFVQQAALQAPPTVNLNARVAYQLMFMEMGFDDEIMGALMPPPPQPSPMDPLTENQLALTQKPITTAPWQDHDSHIAVHMALMQLPNMASHVQEHLGQKMRLQIEQILGQPLPQGPMPPQIQNQVALMTAKAMAVLKAQQQPQPGQPGDPMVEQGNQALQIELASILQKAQSQEASARTQIAVQAMKSSDAAADRQVKLEVARTRAQANELVHGIEVPSFPEGGG